MRVSSDGRSTVQEVWQLSLLLSLQLFPKNAVCVKGLSKQWLLDSDYEFGLY